MVEVVFSLTCDCSIRRYVYALCVQVRTYVLSTYTCLYVWNVCIIETL